MAVITQMSRFTDVITGFAIKEVPPTPNAQIVVGTPGTMSDLIQKRVIDGSKIRVFVLDEADNMLDTGSMGDQTLRVKKCAVQPQML
jgi:ATP-dependent RNA helicase DDX19/DBP5